MIRDAERAFGRSRWEARRRGFGPSAGARWTAVAVLAVLAWSSAPRGQAFAQGDEGARTRGGNAQTGAASRGAGDGGAVAAPRRVPDSLRFAHGLLRQRKYDLAAEEYARFLEAGAAGPDRADALFGLANARLFQRRYPDARRSFAEFLKAENQGPRALVARYRLGELAYLAGDPQSARKALEAFTARGRNHPMLETAWTYLGDVCFSLDDLPAAHRAYERSLKDFPRGRMAHRARYGLARSLSALGDHDGALRLFQQLVREGGPEWADRGWLRIGEAQEAAGRHAEAVEAFQALERAAPTSPFLSEARLRRAQSLKELGRVDEARALLGPLAASAEETPGAEAAFELATLDLEANQAEAALSRLNAAIERWPESAWAASLAYRSAEALRALKRPDEAEARFLRAAAGAPKGPWADDALRWAAQSALDRGDAGKARRLADQYLSDFPKGPLRAQARLIAARSAVLTGDQRTAVALLESLLKDQPTAPNGHADSNKSKSDAPGPPGVQGPEPGAGADPVAEPGGDGPPAPGPSVLSEAETRSARYELALAYRALGQTADADPLLNQLARSNAGPFAAEAAFLIGQEHVQARRYAEAIGPLEDYLKERPRGDVAEHALECLIVAQLGAGQSEAASKTLNTLAERFPRGEALPRCRLRVAEAELASHHADRAAKLFRLVAVPSERGAENTSSPAPKPETQATENGSSTVSKPDAQVAENTASTAPKPGVKENSKAKVAEGPSTTATKPEPEAKATENKGPVPPVALELRARAFAGLGQALLELNKPSEAAAAYAESLKLRPKGPPTRKIAMEEARALEQAGRTDEALERYERLATSSATPELGASAGLARARLLVKIGRNADAAEALQHLVDGPETHEALTKAGVSADVLLAEWGWALVDADRPADADRVFSRLLKEHPNSPFVADARFNLSEAPYHAHDYAKAAEWLAPLVEKPASAGGKGQTAKESDAKAGATAAAPSDRLMPAVLYRLARARVELHDWKAAATALDRLLDQYPDNPYQREARFLQAVAAIELGDASKAEKGLAELEAQPVPDGEDPAFRQAVRAKQIECWVALKRWGPAIDAAESLRKELPADGPAVAEVDYARGQALKALGRMDDARRAFQTVIDARPGPELAAQAQLMRGETYFHEDHFHEALREFLQTEILYDAPRWQAAALLEAGKVQERLDQWPDALATYDRLLDRFPQSPDAKDAQARRDEAARRAGNGRKTEETASDAEGQNHNQQ